MIHPTNGMFIEYVKERKGMEVIWDPYGFAIYGIFKENKECFLQDIFVHKPERNLKHGSSLLEKVIEVAHLNKCETVTATIQIEDPNFEDTLQKAYASGFKIVDSKNRVLIISMSIKGA